LASASKRSYTLIFGWIYPTYFPVLFKTVDAWSDSPEVMSPLLKFMEDFAGNRSQRISFEYNSVSGILLFKDATKFVMTYGSRILNYTPPPESIFQQKYKGMAICFNIMSRCLNGGYCNFGVFSLYRDTALIDAIDVTLRMIFAIPCVDLLSHTKLAMSYCPLLETLCKDHLQSIIQLDSPRFKHILLSIREGIGYFENNIVTLSCGALDWILVAHLSPPKKDKDPNVSAALARHLADNVEVLMSILTILMKKILSDACYNQWTVSRPILSLILLNSQFFSNLKEQIVALQTPENRPKLMKDFEILMREVQPNLDNQNRDRFSQNIHGFTDEVKKYIAIY